MLYTHTQKQKKNYVEINFSYRLKRADGTQVSPVKTQENYKTSQVKAYNHKKFHFIILPFTGLYNMSGMKRKVFKKN